MVAGMADGCCPLRYAMGIPHVHRDDVCEKLPSAESRAVCETTRINAHMWGRRPRVRGVRLDQTLYMGVLFRGTTEKQHIVYE